MTKTPAPLSREDWLQAAVTVIRDSVAPAVIVPPVQVSCSWPGGGDAMKRIGECWARGASKAKINEVFVSPRLDAPARVVGILAHELAHAVDDCKSGHRKGFVVIATAMGCEGNPTTMQPPAALAQAWADLVIAKHGPYPHRLLDRAKSGVKKQTARQIKVECDDCGAVWRMARKWIDAAGSRMSCPVCRSHGLAIEVKEDGA